MTVPAFRPNLFRDATFTAGTKTWSGRLRKIEVAADTPVQEWETVDPESKGQEPGTTKWTLQLEGYQDLHMAGSLQKWLLDNAGETADFEFEPQVGSTAKVTGQMIAVPTTIGGSVNEFATFAQQFPLVGKPTITEGA